MFSESFAISASGLRSQAERLRVTSENIANIDTPGYRAKLVAFEADADGNGGVAIDRVFLSRAESLTKFNPDHPLADENGEYLSSNVSLVTEVANGREAQQSYQANLKMFDQARQMSSELMNILKK